MRGEKIILAKLYAYDSSHVSINDTVQDLLIVDCSSWRNLLYSIALLGPFYGAIAVPSVTRCRCCRRCCCCGHRCAGGMRQWRRATITTPGEWQCKIRTGGVRQLAVANGPNIFQMLLVFNKEWCDQIQQYYNE